MSSGIEGTERELEREGGGGVGDYWRVVTSCKSRGKLELWDDGVVIAVEKFLSKVALANS